MENQAVFMTGIRKMKTGQNPVPQVGDSQVLVQVGYVGVCGSDVHYYEHGRIGDYVVEGDFILGHECAGTVMEIGKNVTNLKVGDRVALEPGSTCGECEFCKSGKYNLCPDVRFFATPPIDGVFQNYVVHDADLCFLLPENVTTMEGALIEPLAVGFHAARQGRADTRKTAVVTGAGCIGLVSLLALKYMGVSNVIVVDVEQKRLEKALELGADGVINGAKEDVIERVMAMTGGEGCELVIDTAGLQQTVSAAIRYCKKGAAIVFVGYSASGEMTLPISLAMDKELQFETVFRYRYIYPEAIEAVSSGKISVKDIVTHVFDFDEIPEAMERCIKEKSEIVKAVIRITD